jgi:hypothetical protein
MMETDTFSSRTSMDVDAAGLFLEAGKLHFGLAISLLTGISTKTVTDHPLTRSESPSDFWGGRWNKQVHGLLKVRLPASQI